MHKLAVFTTFVSFLLIIAGGLVTSTGSGLSVPDWPLSYGTLFPPMVGGIRFEHTHRMIAAAVGLLTLILAVWLQRKEPRRWVRRLGLGALGLVLLQGILGGLTVLWQLPLPVSVAHACLGQTFFAVIVALAQVTSPEWLPLEEAAPFVISESWRPLEEAAPFVISESWRPRRLKPEERPSVFLRQLSFATALAVYGQLILGALLRHTGWLPLEEAAPFVISESWLRLKEAAPFVISESWLRLKEAAPFVISESWRPYLVGAHIVWAVTVAGCIGATAAAILRRHRQDSILAGPTKMLPCLLLVQIGLGFSTLVRGESGVGLATAHVAVGALILATAALLCVRVFYSSEFSYYPPGLSVYLELTKPRLTALAVITSLIGLFLASTGPLDLGKLVSVLLGTAFLGGGAAALNQVLEQDSDARMSRTRKRPIPSGRVRPESALFFGVAASVAGLLILTFGANPLAGTLGAATLGTYLFLYTPLKSRTALCTLIGAIPGALPPLIGWAAARGELGVGAWTLFAILFLWQLPHFLALAWEFREDYACAGFKMLPVLDPDGGLTFRQISLYCAALVPASLLPSFFGLAGSLYFFGALGGSLAFLTIGLMTAQTKSARAAHRLFFASVLYLPFLFVTMTLDKVIG